MRKLAIAVTLFFAPCLRDQPWDAAGVLSPGGAARAEARTDPRAEARSDARAEARTESAAPPLPASLRHLEQFVRSVQAGSVEVRLQQVRVDGAPARTGVAKVQFQRPNLLRWDSRAPSDQLIVADGESLWIYDRDLEQVSVRPLQQALDGLPTALLLGPERLHSAFRFAEMPERDGLTWLEAIPLQKQGLTERIRFGFAQGAPRVMHILDVGGRGMRFEFGAWQIATPPSSAFRFTMPPGVDLIRIGR
jgi:outer membrane lipoprotein carrier protein